MARVITFSRTFPAYHPKKGLETFFVEKFTKAMHRNGMKPYDIDDGIFSTEAYYLVEPKWHTIRSGNRWKVGDMFSPRVWSGKPYASKMIQFAPDIKIEKVWHIELNLTQTSPVVIIDGNSIDFETYKRLALNDGLSATDMTSWFVKPFPRKDAGFFKGQIICWNKNIDY